MRFSVNSLRISNRELLVPKLNADSRTVTKAELMPRIAEFMAVTAAVPVCPQTVVLPAVPVAVAELARIDAKSLEDMPETTSWFSGPTAAPGVVS